MEGVGVRGANALDDEVFAESTGDVGGAAVVGDVRGGGADIEQANTNSTDIEIATTYDGKNGVVVENEDVQDVSQVGADRGAMGGMEVPGRSVSADNNGGGAVGGVEVPGKNVSADNIDGDAVGGLEVPIGETTKGGGEVSSNNVLEEGEIGGTVTIDNDGGEDIYGMGGFEECSGRGADDSVGGVGVGAGVSSVVEPVHHIPRWKLYEILAHAEGECIMSVL